jgi:RNA polymerase sigma-70 factor (ECF subfamily)
VATSEPNSTERLLAEAEFVRRLAAALIRDADHAEDLAQEALVAAVGRQSAPHHWRNWLATVTRRLAARIWRTEGRRQHHEQPLTGAEPAAPEQHTLERLELQQRLTRAVLDLPEPYRTAITLRHFDDLEPREIARRLGWTPAVTRQRIARGKQMLRQRLDRDFGNRTAWLGAGSRWVFASPAAPWVTFAWLAMPKFVACLAALAVFTWLWVLIGPISTVPSAGTASAAVAQPQALAVGSNHQSDAAEPARLAVAAACRVLVRDERSQPLAGATVHCWDASGAAYEQYCDASGFAQFAADGPGGVLAHQNGRQPEFRLLPERRGEHTLVLASGLPCGGTLWIDDQPAPAGIRLVARSAGLPAAEELPEAVAQLLIPQPLEILTTAGGMFHATGLRAGPAQLQLPRTLWRIVDAAAPDDNHAQAPLTPGRLDLDIRTTRLPTLEGKVVWADDGAPVAGAHVLGLATFADDTHTPSTGALTDAHGHFVMPLAPSSHSRYRQWQRPEQRPPVHSVQLEAEAEGSNGPTRLTLDREAVRAGTLTVPLRRAPRCHFLAVATTGLPLAGAIVAARSTSAPTGTDGRGIMLGTAEDVRLVGAPGHRVGPMAPRQPAAGTADDPLVFELPPRNEIVVHVRGPGGAPPPRLRLQLTASELPFAGKRFARPLDEAFGLLVMDQVARNGHEYAAHATTPPTGTPVVLTSLEPGLELRLLWCDALGAPVAETTCTAPPFGGHAECTLVATTPGRFVAGTVYSADGQPLADAGVDLRALDAEGKTLLFAAGSMAQASTRTGATGSFRIGPVHLTVPLRLTVAAPGHAAWQNVLRADTFDAPFAVRLQRGHTVLVHVVDAAGHPVPADVSALEVDSAPQIEAAGVVRFPNLPPATVVFQATIGRVPFLLHHDAREPVAILRVPQPGRLAIRAPGGWPAVPVGQRWEALVQRLDQAEEPLHLHAPDRDGAADTLLLPGHYRVQVQLPGDPMGAPLLTTEVQVLAGERVVAQVR